jgi:hypothetical protein
MLASAPAVWAERRDPRGQLAVLAQQQDNVVSRSQLLQLGISARQIDAQLEARRWKCVGPLVTVLDNGTLSPGQLRWVAVLNAGVGAALCARTALEVDGLRGWEDPGIHVVVAKGARPPTLAGIVLHESRRYEPDRDRHPVALPWRTRIERSAIDAGAWSRSPRTACGLLAAVVQQRLTQSDRLLAELHSAGHVRHRRVMASRGSAGDMPCRSRCVNA